MPARLTTAVYVPVVGATNSTISKLLSKLAEVATTVPFGFFTERLRSFIVSVPVPGSALDSQLITNGRDVLPELRQ